MNEELVHISKIVLADSFKFYIRAHGYHWNVTGSDFAQYHELFSKIYTDTFEAIDVIAEEIRAMGSLVPGSFARIDELSTLTDEREVISAQEMIRRLLHDNDLILLTIRKAYKVSESAENFGFSNLMAERISAHGKFGWMLRASLGD